MMKFVFGKKSPEKQEEDQLETEPKDVDSDEDFNKAYLSQQPGNAPRLTVDEVKKKEPKKQLGVDLTGIPAEPRKSEKSPIESQEWKQQFEQIEKIYKQGDHDYNKPLLLQPVA